MIAFLLAFFLWPRKVVSFRDFAQCLTEKDVTMYGSDTCPNCLNQKSMFGESFQLIQYVKCDFAKEECEQKGITAYPVWMKGEKMLLGTQSLPDLAVFSECELPSSIVEKMEENLTRHPSK